MPKKIRVLHFLVCLGGGGVETLLIDFLKRLPENIHFDFLVHHEARRDDEVRQLGSTVHVLPKEMKSPFKWAKYIEQLVGKHDYDVVHFHRFAFSGNLQYRLRKKVPVRIAHSHSTHFQGDNIYKKLLYGIYHATINRLLLSIYATDILACSNDAGHFLMGSLWTRLKKCRPLFNGIPLDEFKTRMDESDRNSLCNQYGISPNAIVIGTLGRLAPIKNHRFLLQVFTKLAEENRDYVLFIGGEGELKKEIHQQIKDLSLEGRVILPGYCDNSPALLGNLFDVFCLPSLAEGFGITLAEATAAGLCSVCSDNLPSDIVSSFPERIIPVSLNSSHETWGKALKKGISQKKTKIEGIQWIEDSPFTIDNMLKVLLAIYQREAFVEM